MAVDLICAGRAVLAVPEAERSAMAHRVVANAAEADRYRCQFGRAHPMFGDGTLAEAARNAGLAE